MRVSVTNSRKLNCPRCKDRLRVVDVQGVQIDACPECKGAWFDQLEIEALLQTKRDLPNYVAPGYRNWSPSELTCPVCARQMQTLQKNNVFPFDIDMCPVDKGYWFDGGELDQAVATAEQKTLRLRKIDRSAEEEMERRVVRRKVEQARRKRRRRHDPQPDAPALENASFFELSTAQKILIFLGLPVESGRLYEWRSWANLNVVLINIAVFTLMMLTFQSAAGLLGLFPKEWYMTYGLVPNRFLAAPFRTGYTLLTSMFMHGGLFHLLSNMFFLFTTGDDVEKRLGHIPFVLFYLAAGVIADLVSIATGVAPDVPHVGASGAIAGVMGAYVVLCKHKSFYVWLFRIWLFGKTISVSAWLYLLFWFATQLLNAQFGSPGVDHWAHIGGFAFGLLVGKIVQKTQTFNGFTGEWQWRLLGKTPAD